MNDIVPLFCLATIWGCGFLVGYWVGMVRWRGKPRLVFDAAPTPEVPDAHNDIATENA